MWLEVQAYKELACKVSVMKQAKEKKLVELTTREFAFADKLAKLQRDFVDVPPAMRLTLMLNEVVMLAKQTGQGTLAIFQMVTQYFRS